jgi:hypothetical protein
VKRQSVPNRQRDPGHSYNTHDTLGAGGYTGGFDGWEPSPAKILWKSTEHNIDVYVAFMLLWEQTGDAAWRQRAMWAKNFAKAMWKMLEEGISGQEPAVME